MNLIEELGRQYIVERFDKCMFYDPEGRPCFINGSKGVWPAQDDVPVTLVMGSPTKPILKEGSLPNEFFKDLSVFAVPPLGWRFTASGRHMVYYSRNNASYHRALAPKNLQKFLSPVTEFLIETDNLDENRYMKYDSDVLMVMKPEYETLKEGIEKIRAGELVSFCVSPVIAVIPGEDDKQLFFFNTRQVAHMDKEGNIHSENPVIRDYLRNHL